MIFSTIYTIWLREMKKFLREKSRIIGNLATPFFWLAIMGVGLGSTFSIPNSNYSYLSFVAPGIIGMSLLFTSIFSAITIIFDKQFGFMKEILVAPISRAGIVIGKILGSTTTSVGTGIIIFVMAALMGGIPLQNITPVAVVGVLVLMILICFAFVSIGIMIASRMQSMEGFQMVMSFLVIPMFLLSGAFFPIENAPIWLKTFAFIDPLMYGVDGMRGLLTGISALPVIADIGILAGFSLIVILICSYLFSRME